MANLANPHKQFQFSIFLPGMNPFAAQKVTTAGRSIDQVEHGEGNHVIKTAGMVKLENVVIEKISNASGVDKVLWLWIALCQNEITGGGAIPEIYKKGFQVQKLATNMRTAIGTWNYLGAWPCKINGVELNRLASENTIETIELSVDHEAVI